jgi:asparagine synthase (glutamine-hydrolysing)
MCGIAGLVGAAASGGRPTIERMLEAQATRGPDDRGVVIGDRREDGDVALGHLRLSILDLSPAGHQPMASADGRYWVVFNGEIYNFLELRRELGSEGFRTGTDTEVILAAYERWGERCLERFRGMFAIAIWDRVERRLWAARDRFGVKPFHYVVRPDGGLLFSSEIKALHAAGVPAEADETAWSTYLTTGHYDHTSRTFWKDVTRLPPGHALSWHDGQVKVSPWYVLSDRIAAVGEDLRGDDEVRAEYVGLLDETMRLRLRADVPIGINLSGGLDSSILLALVRRALGPDCALHAFTFVTGDAQYDETPWVARMLEGTRHPHHVCLMTAADVPALATRVNQHEDEPFGGLPTLALSQCFAAARAEGVIVLLDGQGFDEQWAGYDYYARAADGQAQARGLVQGSEKAGGAPEVLVPAFRALAEPWARPKPTSSALINLQLADAMYTKIPRALRFNDRASMMHSTELREPFLDERLFELALRQPAHRKIQGGVHKWMLRQIAAELLPKETREAPKRPVQTPQREWLRGPLSGWVEECLDGAMRGPARAWLDPQALRQAWATYLRDGADNSFFVWQWASLGLWTQTLLARRPAAPC